MLASSREMVSMVGVNRSRGWMSDVICAIQGF